MRLLLDTHVALWAIADSPDMPAEARSRILDAENVIFVSAASIWEIAIKRSIGKRNMPISAREALRYFQESGFFILSVTAEHAAFVETLPSHHKDPFDRILVAQALLEPLRLLTHDYPMARYSDTIIPI
jgi:PIN domain nuclease of toxin-antitoxin system